MEQVPCHGKKIPKQTQNMLTFLAIKKHEI